MNDKGKFLKVTAAVIAITAGGLVQNAHAATAAQLATTVNNYGLTATVSGNTVTITGTKTNVTDLNVLELIINADVSVIWKASLTGSTSLNGLVLIGGTGSKGTGTRGSFEMQSGKIENTGNLSAIVDYASAGTLLISGGTVSTAGYVGPIMTGNNNYSGVVIISGGTISGTMFSISNGALGRLSWSTYDGTLTISGAGDMVGGDAPWYIFRNNITKAVIGNSVTSIGSGAFYNSGLTGTLTIPSSVTSIGSGAFYGCSGLTSITIPSSVTSIGSSAFYGCSGLSLIINKRATPQTIVSDVFQGVSASNVKLYVPAQSLSAYKAASVWKDFINAATPFTLNSINLAVGTTQTLSATFDAAYTGDKNITWTRGNTASSISGNTITGVSASAAEIIATTQDGFSSTFTVNVAKGTGTFINIEARSATYTTTLKLSNVSLPANYVWNAPATALSAGNEQSFAATYTDPSGNYNPVSGTITVNVAKATPAVLTLPKATTITYGAALSNSTLSGGSSTGVWAWANGSIIPTVDNGGYEVTFTPNDADNYDWSNVSLVRTVSITVNKAAGLTNTASPRFEISASNTTSHTYSLSAIALNKSDHGALTYMFGAFTDGDGILSAAPALDDDGHTITYIGTGKTSGTATQVITVISQNYNDMVVTLTFKATDKAEVSIIGLTAQNSIYDGAPKVGYIGTATSGVYTGELIYEYAGTGYLQTTTPPTNAGEYTLRVSIPSTAAYIGQARYEFTIAKAKITKPTVATNLVYDGNEQSAGIAANALYNISGDKATNAGGHNAIIVLNDKTNYKWADDFEGDLVLPWAIAKADPQYTKPTGLTAKVGQTLTDVVLSSGWSWMNSAELVGEVGENTHKAKFTPSDLTNYNVIENIDVKVAVSSATPINDIKKSDGRVGIRLSKTVVSDKAEFEVILPDNDKVQEVKAVIYDNTGNVVFTTTQRGANVSWNLTNNAGRYVANGTYLIVVEARGAKGTYAYSTKVGVKR